MPSRPSYRLPLTVTAIYLAGFLLLLAAGLRLTHGRFSYTLDDAYIHLAVAENLAQGQYGLNPGEASSPSSSVLWPLLLAPFASMAGFELLPLLVNLASILAALWLLARSFDRWLAPAVPGPLRATLVLLVALACNFWGMPWNGMEHSAQLLLTLWVTLGVIDLVEDGRLRPSLWLGLVLGPLFRFENYGLLPGSLWVLWTRGRRRAALALLALTVASAAAYLTFYSRQGLPLIPGSVVAKSDLIAAHGLGSRLAEVGENLAESLFKSRIQLALVVIVLLWRRARRESEPPGAGRTRQYAVFLTGAVGAHMVAGRYDWYGRYEIYLLLALCVLSVFTFREPLARQLRRRPAAAVVLALLATVWVGKNQLHATFTSPISASNIYEMHHQMHRFVVDYWRDGVAVNDVGRVSLQNPYYVLDLWGLGSARALEGRRRNAGNQWAEELARSRDIDLLIVFEPWFSRQGALPAAWQPAAEMTISLPPVQVPMRTVTFLLRNPERRQELRRCLQEFRPTLPPGEELAILLPGPD